MVLPPPLSLTLRDGTEVRLVPVTRAHRERLRRGFAEASAESIYRRFLTPVGHLTEDQLDYLTDIDFVDHVAWGAETVPEGHGIGIGRWIRLRDRPTVAEVAVAVLDAYQRRGLATALLRVLAESARERGIELLQAEVLTDNEPVRMLVAKLEGVEVIPEGKLLQIRARL